MKRALMMFALVTLVVAGISAQGKPHMDKGDSAFFAGIDFGSNFGVAGGYELMFHKLSIAEKIPLTFGAAAKAGIDFWPGLEIGVGALANVHFAFTTFSELPEWAQKFEVYTGLGIGVAVHNGVGVGLAYGGGVAYQLDKSLAIISDNIQVSGFVGNKNANVLMLGVRMKL